MKQFFKFTLASALGTILVFAFSFLFIYAIVVALTSSIEKSAPEIKQKSVLYLDFSKPIYDRQVEDFSFFNIDASSSIGMYELMKMIEQAKTDDKINGIYLDVSAIPANGWATVEEIREALLDFKKSGKFIYAYGEIYTQNAYYLSTAADKVAMNPVGHLMLQGIGAQVMYVKDFLDKFDIKAELIRPANNAYKSAGETYLYNKMSDANREQIRAYIDAIWKHVVKQISEIRNIDEESLNASIDRLDGFFGEDAIRAKLIDTLCFESDIHTMINKVMGEEKDNKINFVSYKTYKSHLTKQKWEKQKSGDNIAVIYAYGAVEQGKGSNLVIGSESIAEAIREAADKKSVKAIVLRVNSGGGDAIASEIMTNEIFRAKQKKPVIVSMGDVAASAGYEIACGATKILAMPTTITGSIGVFGIMPEFGTALKKHLGINFDTVSTNRQSQFFSVMHPMNVEGRAVMQRNVEEFYSNFCQRVAEGRGLSIATVDSIARGRVWAGVDAKKIGLIDDYGGLKAAIKEAAKAAKIKDYTVLPLPRTKDITQQVLQMFSDESSILTQWKMKKLPYYSLMIEVESLTRVSGVQARMPYLITLN